MTTEKEQAIRPVDGLANKTIRKCHTMHECCVCRLTIHLDDHYYDGGYGRRAHVNCLANTPPCVKDGAGDRTK
jgi:hypothetical protein